MGSGVSNLLQKPKSKVIEPMNPLQSLLSRVPLHIALQATVVLQSHWRGYLARCKLHELKMHKKTQEAAAMDYLQTLRGRTSSKVISKHFNSDSNDSSSVVSASHQSNRYISIKGAAVNHAPHFFHNPGMDDMIQETSEKSGSFGDFAQETSVEEIIYPFVGFVIKSRLIKSNKKLFINVCHTPGTKVIASTPPRAWVDNTHHDENGLLISTEVAIIDVVIASIDYEEKFSYKEGQGMVPNDENIKSHFADEIIAYLNTLVHCPDPAFPPLKGLTSNEDYTIDEDYKLPKIRRNYVGIICSLIFDRGSNELSYNTPFRLSTEELEASLPEEPKSKVPAPVYNSLPVPAPVSINMALTLASSKGNALIKSNNQEETKKAEETKKSEEEKKKPEKNSPTRKSITSPTSPTKAGGRSNNPANVNLDDDDDNDLLNLESHQLQYIQDMKKTREGIPVYVQIEQGFLFIFQNQTPVVKGASQAFPFGEHELACILCSTVEYFIEADIKNNLFYLHVDLHPEEFDSPFTLSHYFNRYSRKLNKSKLAFQYDTYAEAVTWKYFLELHYDYAKVNYKRCQTFYQNIQFQHYSFSSVNESKTCWLIEKITTEPTPVPQPSAAPTPRGGNPENVDPSAKSKKPSAKFAVNVLSGPSKRKKYFLKIDRGFLGIFSSDTRLTPSWQNAEEIINLATITYDISHRKIIRLRKFMTKITIFDNRNKKREFFIRGDGENDPEIRSIVTSLDTNISYAKSLTFRYFFPWLEESRVIYNTANFSTMGCKVDLMIEIALPETSDDDSDIEDKEPDETIQEIFFKLIRPKQTTPANQGPSTFTSILNSPGFGTNLASPTTNNDHNPRSTFANRLHTTNSSIRGGSSTKINSKDKEKEIKEPLAIATPISIVNTISAIDRFNQKHLMWNDILCDRFPRFVPTYFRASILFVEEMNLLFFYHETTLISCINIFKCLEKTKVVSSLAQRKLKQKNDKKIVSKVSKSDPKLYELESSSDSEEDNSDRDYEDDVLTKKDDDSMIKSRVVHLFGYDGRSYHLKYPNKLDYEEWLTVFRSHGKIPQKRDTLTGLLDPMDAKEDSIGSPETTTGTTVTQGKRKASVVSDNNNSSNIVNQSGQDEDKLPEIVYDLEAAKKYSRLLRPQEKVLASGTILKHEKIINHSNPSVAPKQRRILLITDFPRMIYIDTIGSIVRGHLELQAEMKMDLKTLENNDFEVTVGGLVNRFTCVDPDKDAKFWTLKIKQAIAKLS